MNKSTAVSPGPVSALLGRYAAVLRAAWAAREELAGPRRLAQECAFLPAALALQETPPHPAPRRVALALCALFVLALLWAGLGQLDIVAVGQGRIKLSEGAKQIQPLETSVVKAIHVQEGSKVQAGALLIELDAVTADAEVRQVQAERQAGLAEQRRTRALIAALNANSMPDHLPSLVGADHPAAAPEESSRLLAEWRDIQAKRSKLLAESLRRRAELQTLERQVTKLRTTLPLLKQREQDFRDLGAQGFVSHHAGQDRLLDRVNLEQDLLTLLARRAEALAAVDEGEQASKALLMEVLRGLQERQTQAELRIETLTEAATKARQRQRLTRLTAPLAGTVQQLAVHTVGGVVTPAQTLLIVVPVEAEISAEITLENKDVGFVREGQAAEVKLDAFPYTRYGVIPARVRNISADAVLDEKRGAVFLATLVLEKSSLDVDGRLIRLGPGMNLTAEVKTGKRSVIGYLLDPINKYAHESLKER